MLKFKEIIFVNKILGGIQGHQYLCQVLHGQGFHLLSNPGSPDFLPLKFGSPIEFFLEVPLFSVIRSRYGGLLNLL